MVSSNSYNSPCHRLRVSKQNRGGWPNASPSSTSVSTSSCPSPSQTTMHPQGNECFGMMMRNQHKSSFKSNKPSSAIPKRKCTFVVEIECDGESYVIGESCGMFQSQHQSRSSSSSNVAGLKQRSSSHGKACNKKSMKKNKKMTTCSPSSSSFIRRRRPIEMTLERCDALTVSPLLRPRSQPPLLPATLALPMSVPRMDVEVTEFMLDGFVL